MVDLAIGAYSSDQAFLLRLEVHYKLIFRPDFITEQVLVSGGDTKSLQVSILKVSSQCSCAINTEQT